MYWQGVGGSPDFKDIANPSRIVGGTAGNLLLGNGWMPGAYSPTTPSQ